VNQGATNTLAPVMFRDYYDRDVPIRHAIRNGTKEADDFSAFNSYEDDLRLREKSRKPTWVGVARPPTARNYELPGYFNLRRLNCADLHLTSNLYWGDRHLSAPRR